MCENTFPQHFMIHHHFHHHACISVILSSIHHIRTHPDVIQIGNTFHDLPSGKHIENDGESPVLIGKLTMNGPCSIAMLFITTAYSHHYL